MQLCISNLSKRYPGGVQALADVSLTISTGMFGLLGPNGAGKTTLMRIIAALQEADSGSIRLDDLDVLEQKDEVRKLLGYLPQEFGLYPKVTAWRMIDHFAALKGMGPARQRREVVTQLLRKTNLYEVRHQQLGGFSGGMKQRFGIALALLGNPKLIIVDEPTAGLDPEERVRFHNVLSEIGENVIVILSTHIVGDVSDLCGRMAIIHRGEVVSQGEPLRLAEKLQGRVWKKFISKADFGKYHEQYEVISTRLLTGRLLIHVYNEGHPNDGFEEVAPDLEDVYFRVIKQHDAKKAQEANA